MSDQRPNILHIFTDQLRFDAIGAGGNSVIRTPSLDRLAGMGVSFSHAYTPSPVCVAARCSMITGCYPTRTDCFSNDDMPSDRPSFMELLTRSGYRTHGIGKCHFTPDSYALRGFETRERQEELSPGDIGREPYYQLLRQEGYDYTYEAHGVRGPMYYIPQPSRLPERLHPTRWVGDRAVSFIGAEHDRPWYLFASFIHPHPPFAPPVPWHKLYDPVKLPLPKHADDDESLIMFVNRVQNRYKYRDRGEDLNLVRCIKAYYYSCVSFVDCQVGRMLDALEDSGQLDNTLIVFSSDHGELLGDYGCFGKRSMQDGAARIPLLMYRGGMLEGGRTIDAPVSLVDLAPTFLDAAGVDASHLDGDGASLLGTLPERRLVYSMFSCYQEMQGQFSDGIPEQYLSNPSLLRAACGNYMITDGRLKYIYSAPDRKELLLSADTDGETHNYVCDARYADILASLRSQLIKYLESRGLTCLSSDGKWAELPLFSISENPDAGLIKQNITCPWFNETLHGYNE